MKEQWLIKGGRVLDPVTGEDRIRDLYIKEGRFANESDCASPTMVDATSRLVTPGLIDIHVHLREPGGEVAETIQTGCEAAARGGFTTLVAMPNTIPAMDSAEVIAGVLDTALSDGVVRVLASGCLTVGRKGEKLADYASMRKAGAVTFTDDGSTIQEASLMESAARAAAALGCPIMDHAEDESFSGGAMNEGDRAEELGLPGISSDSETSIVVRDIEIAKRTGCTMHIQHLSSALSVELIRKAKADGLPVTCEVTPHHLAFCENDVQKDNPGAFKMNPPLRSQADMMALRDAVADGAIDTLATDHAPHSAESKAKGFCEAPFGVVGLETAVGASYKILVIEHGMSVMNWLKLWTIRPAVVLGIDPPSLAEGQPADVSILDLESSWLCDPADFASKSRNTPFAGESLVGRAVCTFLEGRMIWSAGE